MFLCLKPFKTSLILELQKYTVVLPPCGRTDGEAFKASMPALG